MFKIIMILAMVGTCNAASIKVLGIDGNSKIVMGEMRPDIYVETIFLTKNALDQQAISGLENFKDKGPSWRLSRISMSVGVTGEVGFGPFKYGKSLKQRFVYTRY
ncbi:MAG TPA: hypothetical protein VNJ08_16050 [Bacteriovoracaceae bacterium]|nr:hypothetical protein [Bacteriovoracaceae bacterium]